MKLITLSGLDGSGKSTQIELLKAYLESQGKKVFYFHAIQFSLANLLKNKYYNILRPTDTITKEKSVMSASWLKIALRKIFLQIDIWRFKLLLNELLNKNYDYILSDRFFHDSIINIAYLENSNIGNWKLIENWKLNPPAGGENYKFFYLQTDPELIMQRDRKPDQGLEYLQKKKELYDKYSVIWDMKIIDGNREKNIIFEELKNLCQI